VRRGYRFELLYLPGLTDVVRAEVAEVLPGVRLATVPGREDSLAGGTAGDVAGELRRLRTVVAAFQVLTFRVPRPRSLLSGEYLPHIAEAIRAVPGPR
jgi:tRNA (guanine6-N2)-methyltransferase